MMNVIKTQADLETAIAASHEQPIVIFKHSATCPFSAMAQMEVANSKHDLEIHCLVVQYVPELSAAVAEQLDVEHASPQAIVVSAGKAQGKYWRSEIKEYRLKEAVKEIAEA
jgi:bacillithiol system protein YtxJ